MVKTKISIGTTTPLRKFLIVTVASLAFAHSAAADSTALFSAGVGTTLGASSVTSPTGQTESAFSNELSLRLKFLYALGLDLAYAPADQRTSVDGLVFGAPARLSGLLYVVPTDWFSLYAKGGIEGDHPGAWFTSEDPSNAYHVGGGVEVPVVSHWVIGLEFLVLIPGIESVEDHFGRTVSDLDILRTGTAVQTADTSASIPEPGDYISGNNFRLTASVRYFF